MLATLQALLPGLQLASVATALLPDSAPAITAQLLQWCDVAGKTLVITTGGTGFSPRDVTPQATAAVLQRRAPGLVAAMLAASLRATPMAALSCYEAGMRGGTLIINLPGSVKAVKECLGAIASVLPHALALLAQGGGEGAGEGGMRH